MLEMASVERQIRIQIVIRGLDPRIHQSSQKFLQNGWIAGSSPQVSGTIHASCGLVHGGAGPSISTPPRCACCFWLEVEGGLLRLWRWLGVEKLSNRSAEHQVCPDKPCEGERDGHDFAGVVSQPQ